MDKNQLLSILEKLLKLPDENEVVEFKSAKASFNFRKLGKYFSALSNEANLQHLSYAWLVFGVDKNHNIVGTNYRQNKKDLNNLKFEIAEKTHNRLTFIDIFELIEDNGRVIMFQIPAAPRGIPTAFDGYFYGRDNESLGALNINELERIRSQVNYVDWSAGIIKEACLDDLDPEAISVARKNYKEKFPSKRAEVDTWDDITFLNKTKITIRGQITRTTLILLGKEDAESLINPSVAVIRWLLKDASGNDRDYQIFHPPLLLVVNQVFSKIRNLKYRYIKDESLFPDEVDQYEPFSIREALNNCIAHQDYSLGGMINVVELDDSLIFTNLGIFIPKSVEKVIIDNAPEEQYRNPFLATAMFNLNMVDTQGGGIRKIFGFQRARFFPLPDYELFNKKVKLTLIGKVLDLDYAKILAQNRELTLQEIILLDKVQKKQALTDSEAKYLKENKLIEGRKPNYYFSLKLSQKIGDKAKYSKNSAFNKQYYLDLIKKLIKEHTQVSRQDIDELLWEKLPNWMDNKQKKNKITNLLSELRDKKEAKNIGSFKYSKWVLIKKA